jgi:O-antigen/teichoic acid export membrane protein
MSEQLKNLGRHTLVYTAGIVIGKAASFIMLPVYTRYLSPADYGILELLGMTIDVIGMITGVGLVAGVFKFYAAEDDPKAKNAIVSTAALGVTALAALTSLIGVMLAPQLTTLIFGNPANQIYLRMYFLLFLLQNMEYVPLLLIRAENRSVMFVALNTSKLLVMLSLNIVFVVLLRMGVAGAILSSVIATAGTVSGLSVYMVRRAGLRFSKAKFLEMLRFGGPLVFWWLGSFVLVFSDRYFLNYYIGTSTVGIYSLAYKFAFLLNALAYTPFSTVWTAQRFEVAKRQDATELYARVFFYLNLILGGLGLVLSLFVRDFLSVMSAPAFLPAYRVVPLLVAAQVVFTWADYWTLGIYVSGRTRAMAVSAIVLVPITLALNFLLIPRFGMFGAAWATFGAYTIRFLVIYHFAQQYYPIPYRWTELGRLYLVLGGAGVAGMMVRLASLPRSLMWNTALLLISIGVVYQSVLSHDDRVAIKSFLATYFATFRRQRSERIGPPAG